MLQHGALTLSTAFTAPAVVQLIPYNLSAQLIFTADAPLHALASYLLPMPRQVQNPPNKYMIRPHCYLQLTVGAITDHGL